METTKPQLHASQLATLAKCGEQYRRRYIEGEIIPPSSALLVGTATHRSVEANLRNKVRTGGTLLSIEQVQATAADAFTKEWDNGGVRLEDDEVAEGANAVKGKSVDLAVALATVHAEDLAPSINPISENHIERRFVIDLVGYPFDLAGTIDIQERSRIRDTKTSGKTLNQADADGSEQLTMYALGAHVLDSIPMPVEVVLDALVKLKTPKAVSVTSKRELPQVHRLLRRIERAAEVIDKGMFMPAQADSWICSAKFCGYHATCPFWSGRP